MPTAICYNAKQDRDQTEDREREAQTEQDQNRPYDQQNNPHDSIVWPAATPSRRWGTFWGEMRLQSAAAITSVHAADTARPFGIFGTRSSFGDSE